ncbi:MAG: hypothetical protein WDN24_02255 [Sphingomonas sp.]
MSASIGIARALALSAAAMLASGASAQTGPASASDVRIPLSDARNIGPNSVRFAAIQASRTAPAVVILGVTKANWPKLNAAMQKAVFDGYPIEAIFIGPQDATPALEIYVKGHHVTNPINPNEISSPELTKLIKDVTREYYR